MDEGNAHPPQTGVRMRHAYYNASISGAKHERHSKSMAKPNESS